MLETPISLIAHTVIGMSRYDLKYIWKIWESTRIKLVNKKKYIAINREKKLIEQKEKWNARKSENERNDRKLNNNKNIDHKL